MPQVTDPVEVPGDGKFEHDVDITKAWTDDSGRRFIRGVASGLLEDHQGERVSRNAIRKMAEQGTRTDAGDPVMLTSAHQQDWMTEIGKASSVEYDPDTDELLPTLELPPEGEDAIADKAWNKLTIGGERMGLSIGGKCRKAFFELVDQPSGVAKRRKVLDDIAIRHYMLTKRPAYPESFVAAVAKTAEGIPEPSDEDFHEVEKADDLGDSAGNSKRSDDRNAGEGKPSKGRSTETPDDKGDKDDDLPKAKQERHLACPNCGHEFAADLPPDNSEDKPSEDLNEGKDKDNADTGKTAPEETDMPAPTLTESLDELKTLAGEDEPTTAKTDDEPTAKTDEPAEPETAKTDEPGDEPTYTADEVAKMVAASHRKQGEDIAKVRDNVNEVLGAVAKAVVGLAERIDNLPRGRKSVARVLPPANSERSGGEVAKTDEELEEVIEKTDDPVEALKAMNRRDFGIE